MQTLNQDRTSLLPWRLAFIRAPGQPYPVTWDSRIPQPCPGVRKEDGWKEPSCLEAFPLLVECVLTRLTPLSGKTLWPRKGPDCALAVLPVCGGAFPYSEQPLKNYFLNFRDERSLFEGWLCNSDLWSLSLLGYPWCIPCRNTPVLFVQGLSPPFVKQFFFKKWWTVRVFCFLFFLNRQFL